MNARPVRFWFLVIGCLLAAGAAMTVAAADEPPPVFTWQAVAEDGQALVVPGDRPTLLLFVRHEQERSDKLIAAVRQLLAGDAVEMPLQIAAVVSGPQAQAMAKALSDRGTWSGPVVVDPQHETSGRFRVYAWPTAVLLDAGGVELAHLAGLPQSLSRDLGAYLDFAAGKIDRDTLNQRLATNGPVGDQDAEAAGRRGRLIEQLMARGQVELAQRELRQALAQAPDDRQLRLLEARLHLRRGQAREALTVLEALPADDGPVWQVQTLRGRAHLQLGQLQQARTALAEAITLNPQPAEAHYLLGRVHEQQQQWSDAAGHYRKAFEATAAGRAIVADHGE